MACENSKIENDLNWNRERDRDRKAERQIEKEERKEGNKEEIKEKEANKYNFSRYISWINLKIITVCPVKRFIRRELVPTLSISLKCLHFLFTYIEKIINSDDFEVKTRVNNQFMSPCFSCCYNWNYAEHSCWVFQYQVRIFTLYVSSNILPYPGTKNEYNDFSWIFIPK